MALESLQIGSTLLQFVAAWMTLAFILGKRVGRAWILVFLGLLLTGGLSAWTAVSGSGIAAAGSSVIPATVVEFLLSALLAAVFFLAGKGFRVDDRLESQGARRHDTYANAKSSYDDLLRNLRDGVLLIREGKVVRANPAAAVMLGYPDPGVLFDLDPASILVEGDAPENLRYALRGPGTEGTRSDWEAVIRKRDGSTFTGEISVTWIPRGNRKETFVPPRTGPLGMAILRDVTDRRHLEKQIIEMQKMEAVGTLAGGIAHDFNNILTGILGSLDAAQRRIPADSGAAGPISDAIRASERAVALIRQLLDFSRRSPSEQRPVNLGNVVREAATLFSQTIDRRIEVISSIEDGLPLAIADPNKVHQVLMNLCINARDAILETLDAKDAAGSRPLTGYWIYVRAEKTEVDDEYCRIFPYARKGRFVRLSIGDNGAGMDEALRHRVFEPFFTTKKMGRGTGLGLSTVYGIVKQHNGWINLDSCPGKGTTFCAYFPEAVGAVEEPERPADAARPVEGKETVLFADDEELIRDLGRMVLESYGYTVCLASDGKEAIARYAENPDGIHLVLVDMTMPQHSGIEVLQAIRRINPRAKVILSSGNTPAEDIGDTVFLPKPYRADTLARAVRTALDADVPGSARFYE